MASADIRMPMSSVGHHITVNVRVTGMRVFMARWWLARKLLLLAARVAGCNIAITLADESSE